MQDYLEAILVLVGEKGAARVRDIASRLGVRSSTVSNALHSMAKRGLVHYKPYELVTLTDKGRDIADRVQRRHDALRKFFVEVLGLEADRANTNACRIEHEIDDVVLRKLGYLAEFIERSGHFDSEQWHVDFARFCKRREREAPACRSRGEGRSG